MNHIYQRFNQVLWTWKAFGLVSVFPRVLGIFNLYKYSFISKPIWIELLYGILWINLVISSKNRKISHIHNTHTHINIQTDENRSYSFHSKTLAMNQVNIAIHSGLCSPCYFYPNYVYVSGKRNKIRLTVQYEGFLPIFVKKTFEIFHLHWYVILWRLWTTF